MDAKTIYIILGAVGLTAVVTVVATVMLTQDNDDDSAKVVNQIVEDDANQIVEYDANLGQYGSFSNAPAAPEFNSKDNKECREYITQVYDSALRSWESWLKTDALLEEAYAKVLTAQSSQNVEIMNNADFLEWTVSDWETSWLAQNGYMDDKPELSKEMYRTFMPTKLGLPKAENVRTIAQLDEAVSVLYSFRLSAELEEGIMTIMGWTVYPDSEYAMCSEDTREYAQIPISYNLRFNGNSHNTSYMEYGPLLDKISKWIESQ